MVALRTYLFLALGMILAGVHAQLPSEALVPIGMAQGLPGHTVYEVSQDQEGWIWMATSEGLVSWTDTDHRIYTTTDGLPRNDIRAMYHLPDGGAWILSSGALTRMNSDHSFEVVELPGIQQQRIYATLADRLGNQWFLGSNQLFCYSPNEKVDTWNREDLGLQGIMRLESDWKGEGVMVSGQNGLVILGEGREMNRVNFRLAEEVPESNKQRLIRTDGESYLIAGHDRWFRLTEDLTTTLAPSSMDLPSPSEVLGGDVCVTYGLLLLAKNQLLDIHWMDSLAEEHVKAEVLLRGSVLEQYDLQSLFVDQESNIWVSTANRGVLYVSGIALENHHLSQCAAALYGPRSNGSTTALTTSPHGFLLGTQAGEIFLTGPEIFHPDQFRSWSYPAGGAILQLEAAEDGWIGVIAEGLLVGSWDLPEVQLLPLRGTKSLHSLGRGEWVLSVRDRFHYKIDWAMIEESLLRAEKFATNLENKASWVQVGFSSEAVVTPSNTFWVRVEDGLMVTENLRNKSLSVEKISFSGEYTDLALWGKEWVVAGAGANGIEVFQGTTKVWPASPADRWTYGPVEKVLADSARQLLVAVTNQGLVKFRNLPQPGTPYLGTVYSGPHGLPAGNIEAVVFSENTHYIASLIDQKLFLMRDQFQAETVAGHVGRLSLRCVRWPGGVCQLPWTSTRWISKDSASMEFFLASNSYRYLSDQVIEYRFNEDPWMIAVGGKVSTFALPPGSYILDARVVVGEWILAESRNVISWYIRPPFYQSWWFVFFASLALVALIWGAMSIYYGGYERRTLEKLVLERTRALDETIMELRRSNEDLEQFAYIASHDLKSPLRGMIGHLQLVQRRYGKTIGTQGTESILYAVNEAKRLYDMVADLLDYASVGSEKLEKKQVYLRHLVGTIEQGMMLQLREGNAKIIYGDLPAVEVVPSQYEALFRNLIENGLKFNDSAEPTVKIDFRPTEGFWVFVVSDNGIGIDQQFVQKAFELYARLNPEFPGTGIGLALCKRVVERHGGTIWVESELGKGSSFYFSLPRS